MRRRVIGWFDTTQGEAGHGRLLLVRFSYARKKMNKVKIATSRVGESRKGHQNRKVLTPNRMVRF
jgi:hypothetical protein